MVVVEAGKTLLAGYHVRGDTSTFRELNMPVLGVWGPEITGLCTRTYRDIEHCVRCMGP